MPEPSTRAFDLNVGTVLEHWTPEFALREIIANALDEQVLTETSAPTIKQGASGWWHIRDFGRGVRHVHLTQDESSEKQNDDRVIGQFGMGLKDALALFDRLGISVSIRSRHGDITLGKHTKSGFNDVVTLHALVSPPSHPDMQGTDFAIHGVTETQIRQAKDMFLAYRGDEVLEQAAGGEVIGKPAYELGRVYVRGLLVATEDNFLFSYNITTLNAALKKALNRERSNVGRTAYAERVKRILLDCKSESVAGPLARDLAGFSSGDLHDEVAWTDVAVHATRVMQTAEKVIFVSTTDFQQSGAQLNHARSDGYEIIHVPEKVVDKLANLSDFEGRPMVSVRQYANEWNDSFRYSFVPEEDLTDAEQGVLGTATGLMSLLDIPPVGRGVVRELLITETMRIGQVGVDADGVWEPAEQRIIIARHQLSDRAKFAGTLLHELCHARSGHSDLSIAFENDLSDALGAVAQLALN